MWNEIHETQQLTGTFHHGVGSTMLQKVGYVWHISNTWYWLGSIEQWEFYILYFHHVNDSFWKMRAMLRCTVLGDIDVNILSHLCESSQVNPSHSETTYLHISCTVINLSNISSSQGIGDWETVYSRQPNWCRKKHGHSAVVYPLPTISDTRALEFIVLLSLPTYQHAR